jgi:hypothetical protein
MDMAKAIKRNPINIMPMGDFIKVTHPLGFSFFLDARRIANFRSRFSDLRTVDDL